MNHRFLIDLARAWQIATGYPIPHVPFGKQSVSDNYLSRFPLCGFAIGLIFFLIAKLFRMFAFGTAGIVNNTLCALVLVLLGEAITHGEGLACLSVITGRCWKQLDKTVFCINQYRDFSIASIIYVLMRFLAISVLLYSGHPECFLLIFTAGYCGRIELGFAKTESKAQMFHVSQNAAKAARFSEIISFVVILFLLFGNGTFLVILFYAVATFGVRYYLLAKQLRGDFAMTHARYQAIAYALEIVFLLSAASAFSS